LERDVFIEMNRARTDPSGYAASLEKIKQHYDKQFADTPLQGTGEMVFGEAIQFLKAATPQPALKLSRGLSAAARDHVRDQGPTENTGHLSRDGSDVAARLSRHGTWEIAMGENVAYGSDSAQRFVMQQVIDLENPDRTHRKNIFQPDFMVAGVACGEHARYRNMCVITFAGKYLEKQ
jgi:uncharacterized protein YkwD